MRALVQRVTRAAVEVVDDDGAVTTVGSIGPGLCVLVGVTHDDTPATADAVAGQVWTLRVFDDETGTMNRSAADVGAEVLVVSQFTLYGDTSRGRRPSWAAAARPEHAEPLVDRFVAGLRAAGARVATGRFRAAMRVALVNDGPVTLMLERADPAAATGAARGTRR